MFHIGFDPLMETQQGHKELIRQNELIRLAQDCTAKTRAGFLSFYRLLAQLGKWIAMLGIDLEARFGDGFEEPISISNRNSSGSCSS